MDIQQILSKYPRARRREFCRRGGVKSGVARRKKALERLELMRLSQAAASYILSSPEIVPVCNSYLRHFVELAGSSVKTSDLTSAIAANLYNNALSGDFDAIEFLFNLGGKE